MLHIENHLADPTKDAPLLHYLCTAIRRSQGDRPPRRLPITITLLRHLKANLSVLPHLGRHDKRLYWAAFSLAFYGFLRVSEFTPPFSRHFNSRVHLLRRDVTIHPGHLELRIKRSKTDQFRQSATVIVGATESSTCPVRAMTRFLRGTTGHSSRPLFTLHDGSYLTRSKVSRMTKHLLSAAGVDTTRFSSHSFRIGAATAAAAAGLPETLIQALGRWRSSAYKTYVRSSRDLLCGAARLIAHQD